MKKIRPLLLFMLTLMFINCKNDDNGNTIEQVIDPDAFYVDQDHPNASDDNDGRYIEDGGTGPWLTIQHMLNTLEAGETGYVRASSSRYLGTTVTTAFDQIAFNISKSGTLNSPIIISGYPGERPVIGLNNMEDAVDANVGGFVSSFNTSYVTIRNFEISNVSGTGIFTDPDGNYPNIGMVFEDLHIYNVIVGDNGACIRLDFCDQCVVRNNILHDVYDKRSTAGNPINDSQYRLGSGIHGFQPSDCIIENNLFYNLGMGVFQKQADVDHQDSHMVRNNIFHDLSSVAFSMQIQGAGGAAPRNASFYNNILYDTGGALWVPLQDVGEQGIGLKIYNNTLVNTSGIGSIQEMIDIEIFNNIVQGDRPSWSTSSNETSIFRTEAPMVASLENGISYFDNNIYYDLHEHWILESGSAEEQNIYGLDVWSTNSTPSIGLLNPDQNSRVIDPLFIDAANHNYTLQNESPALSGGRGGNYSSSIGAVRDDISIGPDWELD